MSKKESQKARDPIFDGFDPEEFFNNRLSLPAELKKQLTEEGLDWRFLNSVEFRTSGNVHRSHWRPYKLENPSEVGIDGITAEGHIKRGDLILGVRPKNVSKAHKAFLTKRNQSYSQYNKEEARKLKKLARDYGVEDQTKVFDGYDEN